MVLKVWDVLTGGDRWEETNRRFDIVKVQSDDGTTAVLFLFFVIL